MSTVAASGRFVRARYATAVLLALVLLALPAYLFWDQLAYPSLQGDDFAFLAESKSGAEPTAHLLAPHNAHVVPLFRMLTAGLAASATSPGGIASRLQWATYVGLVLVLLGAGHLAAWESRRLGLGLAVMALVGISSILEPSATWYSAGQTLWAAIGILGTLVLLQTWRAGLPFGPLWLIGAGMSAFFAPALWGGGIAAGPVGAVYLWTSGGLRERRAAMVPLLAGIISGVATIALARGAVAGSLAEAGRRGSWPILGGIGHGVQAVLESLVLGGLGLDAEITATQGTVFVLGLAAAWAASRGRPLRFNPLEAAGLTMVTIGYLTAFGLRAGYQFEDLRDLGWYDAIPFVGAVLFGAGWWMGRVAEIPGPPRPPTFVGLLGVAGLAVGLLVLHLPRVEGALLAEAPPRLDSEREQFPILSFRRLRARHLREDLADRQRRALDRIGTARAIAEARGIGLPAIRAAFGRVEVPGWPRAIREFDALDLLDFPTDGPIRDPRVVRATFGELFAPERVARPGWLLPTDPWPPPMRPGGDRTPETSDPR